MERVEPSGSRVADIDHFSVEGVRQFDIFVFGVKDKDLGVFGRKVRQQGLCAVRFTRTGLADDDHVGIDTFAVSSEKVDENRHAVLCAQTNAAFV